MGAVPPLDAAAWAWPEGITAIGGGVCAASGISAAGVAAGIKKSRKPDVALIVAEKPATAAGVFTTNAFAASCVDVSRTHAARGTLRAIVASAGNANACTGPAGFDDTVAMAARVAQRLGCSAWDVAVASTGVIGVPLPMDAVAAGIDAAAGALSPEAGDDAAEAIMTTDTFAKTVAVEVALGAGVVRIGAMAKGSGMIRPDMATMLGFVTTDAALTHEQAQRMLTAAAGRTFNRITVDGETSTNDMVLVLATGASGVAPAPGSADEELLEGALVAVSDFLARQIVRDGEGATKFVEVVVTGAADEGQAERVAFAVAESPLLKCALFGQDANWGRVLSAVGASGVAIDPGRVSVRFGDHLVALHGARADFDEAALSHYLTRPELAITVDLGLGAAQAVVCTTDLTYDYVKINADYRT